MDKLSNTQNLIVNEIFSKVPDIFEDKVKMAISFAHEAYKQESRLSGQTVFNHALRVGREAARLNLDTISIITAILHQVLYDEDNYKKHGSFIQDAFGDDVKDMLVHLHKINIATKTKNIRNDETIRNYLIYGVDDLRVTLIKLADILENSKEILPLPKTTQKNFINKVYKVYGPIADFLNLSELKKIIEENAFEAEKPDEYNLFKGFYTKNKINQQTLKNIQQYLQNLLRIEDLECEVYGRVKSLYSMRNKEKKYFSETRGNKLSDIPDAIAYTVLLKNEEECHKAAEIFKIFTNIDYSDFDDYITKPKPNGYRSIQFPTKLNDFNDITVEIQIKTTEMHYHSTYGPSSHIAYKLALKRYVDATDKYSWLECIHHAINEHINLRETRMSIPIINQNQSDNIFVFTPKGMIIELDKNSTVKDFASKIHTKFRNAVTAASINGNGALLNTKLKTGDTINLVLDRNSLRSTK